MSSLSSPELNQNSVTFNNLVHYDLYDQLFYMLTCSVFPLEMRTIEDKVNA